jgi:AmpD protein
MIDDHGWLSSVRKVPSPNCNDRPDQAVISLLVIHNISLPPRQFGGSYICDFFSNCLKTDEHPYFAEIDGLEVSAHLLIDREGRVTQFVPLNQRAWHAGQSCFEGIENCNDFSIGIELEGADDIPYSDKQYQTLVAVTNELMRYYPAITQQRIVGHSDIAAGRKTDPGPAFDWPRYLAAIHVDR